MKQKKYFDKLILLVTSAFVFLLPLDFNILSPLIGAMGLLAIFQYSKSTIVENIVSYKYYFIFFILLLVWQLISLTWSSDISRGLKTIEHRAFYVVAPLLFVLFKKWPSNKLIKIFIISNFLICVYSFGHLIYFFINEKMYFIDRTIRDGIQLETFRYIAYHSGVNFISFGVHRLYFSFSLLSSLLFMTFYKDIFKYKYLKYLIAFTFIFVIFLLLSKISIILLIMLLLYSSYKKFIESTGKKRIVILSTFITIFCLGFYISKIRFHQSIDQIGKITENKEGSLIERFQYAKCSLELIGEAPFFGYGVGDVDDVVKEKLIKYNYTYLIERGIYDPHNEFLKAYISMGIIGFLLFLGIFISLFYKAYKEKNPVLLLYIGFVFIICLIEPFLSRQAGILPVLFFMGLLAYKGKNSTSCEYSKIA